MKKSKEKSFMLKKSVPATRIDGTKGLESVVTKIKVAIAEHDRKSAALREALEILEA